MKGSDSVGWPPLAEIRCSRKVSLEQIAACTRIRLHHLIAIEQGDFEKLPGGIYTTSYIRQYARLIDFPEQELLARFSPATAPSSETRWGSRPFFIRWLAGFVSWTLQRMGVGLLTARSAEKEV